MSSSNEYAISLKTNRLIKKSTANYRKLKKLGMVREINEVEESTPTPKTVEPTPEPVLDVSTAKQPTPEFDEAKLQMKLGEISTDMIQKNLKKVVKAQKLSDAEMDDMLKRLLYKKLCMAEPTKPAKKEKPKKKAKKKFKIVEPSSESESESD